MFINSILTRYAEYGTDFNLAGVILTPCYLYWLWPPVVRNTSEAPSRAAARLEEMGPLSTDEKIMIGAVLLAVLLWVCVLVAVFSGARVSPCVC